MSLYTITNINNLFNNLLNEDLLEESARQDLLQHLVNELGKDKSMELLDKFYNYKRQNRLGNMNPDPSYWVNKSCEEFINSLSSLDFSIQERNAEKQKWIDYENKNVIYRDNNWLVINIITFEAAQKYGKNTQWCITATNANKFGKTGEDHFDEYYQSGIKIYFYIRQNVSRDDRNVGYTYNADGSIRSTYSQVEGGEKWAACVYPQGYNQIFDEHNIMVNDIPNKPAISSIDRVPIVKTTILINDNAWLIQKFTSRPFKDNLYLTNKLSDGEEYIYWVNYDAFESDAGRWNRTQFINHSDENAKLVEEHPEIFG